MTIKSGTLRRLVLVFDWTVTNVIRRVAHVPPRHLFWKRFSKCFGFRIVEVLRAEGMRQIIDLRSMADVTSVLGRPEESPLEDLVKALKPGAVFFDVGANAGRYTLMAAAAVGGQGEIHAFEPSSAMFDKLARNCAINRLTNAVLNPVALSHTGGTADILYGSDDGWATLHSDWLPHVGNELECHREQVATMTLSEYINGRSLASVDLIKVDVEGHELLVLSGAAGYLDPSRVKAWAIEVHSPIVSAELVSTLLSEAGYQVRAEGQFVLACV